MSLKYVDITMDNILLATKFEMKLFPNSCGYNSFLDAMKNGRPYQLVYDEEELVGTCGLYTYPKLGEKNTIWLGWFGVDATKRRKGYGTRILNDMINKAKQLDGGFDTFRLYTSAVLCPEAMLLYNKVMDFGEPYTLEEQELQRWVFTKSLNGKKAKKWNNRPLHLDLERPREEDGRKKYLIHLEGSENENCN